jgi:carbonic anhydrase/acetyltransferase-like protein (isoleucine patch superfamily)
MAGPIILPWRGVSPQIASDAFIAPNAVIIGDVVIGPGVTVWFNCVLRGDVNHIRVGARTNIQDGTVVHVSYKTHPTVIGEDVLIGHMATIHGCTLEAKAFIGMRATVMDGVVVEREGMVAAGALVSPNKRIPQRQMWAGSPAKFARDVKPEELKNFADAVERYVSLGEEYRALFADKTDGGSI